MILPDVNLLLYATMTGLPEHGPARRWIDRLMNGQEPVGLPAPVLFAFIRLATNPRVFRPALAVDAAIRHVESWLARPHVQLLLPGPRHLDLAFSLLRKLGAAQDLTSDVQLAALALEHQAEVHSNDADFGRFPGLRWVNPITP